MKIDFSKVPVAATLANILPEESIDFHFVTLDFYLLWEDEAFLESSRCSFYQRKVFTFALNTVLAFSVELLVTLDLTLATEFSTVRNMDFFSIVFG